jgi:hypothetical protein
VLTVMAPHTSGIGQSDKTGEPGGAVGGGECWWWQVSRTSSHKK